MKKAVITGIAGQDGSYLTDFLLTKGYKVFGLVKDKKSLQHPNLSHLLNIPQLKLFVCSVDDYSKVRSLIAEIVPDECYHFAARSFVSFGYGDEISVMKTNFNGTQALLSSIMEYAPACKFYFAGSSEMFGQASVCPQNESTPFNPRSTYGISKLASFHLVKKYREYHELFACNGIAYNHESIRREHVFVTRKITSTVAKIYLGKETKLHLGNLDAVRDWGYAPDYIQAMWKILQQKKPRDYVISTGIGHTVEEFVKIAFSCANLDYKKYVKIKSEFIRPGEKVALIGDSSKLMQDLGWKPKKQFNDIIKEMVMNDIERESGNEKDTVYHMHT